MICKEKVLSLTLLLFAIQIICFGSAEIVVNLNIPTDNAIETSNPIDFNCSANITTGTATIRNISLYSNHSGSWVLNETKGSLEGYGIIAQNLTEAYACDDNTIKKTFTLNKYVEAGINEIGSQFGVVVNVIYSFTYSDGSNSNVSNSYYHTSTPFTYSGKTYINPFPNKLVTKIDVWTSTNACPTIHGKIINDTITGYNGTNYSSQTFSKQVFQSISRWNCLACDSDGVCNFSASNFTFSMDYAKINITSPAISVSSATILVNSTITASGTLDYCFYNITRGASTEKTNTEINCSQPNATYILSGEATYNLWVFANTTTGFNSTSNRTFIYSAGSVTPGGGGGSSFISSILGRNETRVNVCGPFREQLLNQWEETKEQEMLARIKFVWDNWWNFAICGSASSIVPIG